MDFLEKFQSIILLIAIILGLILGQIAIISNISSYFIIVFLFLMLFAIFLSIFSSPGIDNFKSSFKNLKFTKIAIFINFIWTPILAYILGYFFLNSYPQLWIGFIMLLVTPCTDWYLIFTDIAKGNLPLSLSILPLNLFLQIILLPIYLFIFTGVLGSFDISILIESILFIIVLPFILALITNYFLRKREFIKNKVVLFFNKSQIIFLSLAIFCMFASQGSLLISNYQMIFILLIPLILFFIINFIIARISARLLNFDYEDYASLSLTTLARNSPISLAIAVTAFPQEPIIAIVLVIAPLIELPVLAVVSQILLLFKGNY